ncbi:universal stress protein [Streptomyces sp. NBC_01221]|nr:MULTISPECIES: universal stress protein [unclassified Streptomyces]WSP53548.1 universal stress protein [Streptomyces sp. NBC_01241]MCX4784932.1 universal stress protein [Streptomyces sp. NBC_01221]MCX4799115.1 universal stress protein [Streptomyces sp. NBC_01242]WSJ40312.1 universal stress protein [Streptomyces sp. NBC_01321]WSP66616.1 universal stress protein [Streptomyces sp. NBC_01240]
MGTDERRELVIGIDPARNWHLSLAWAADEAHRRGLELRLVVAVPPSRDRHHGDDSPGRQAMLQAGADALREGADWARARHPQLRPATDLLDGFPAAVLGGLSARARMVVLGSRHLSRTAEYFSAGSLVVPVTAQARCPVVVVGDAEHITQEPTYLVVGIDGSESSKAALGLAFEEADLRGAALRAVSVWQPPVVMFQDEQVAVQAQRRMLYETTAGWSSKYPDVHLTHEVPMGHPVEELAGASEHALAVIVGRRGRGGYTGMRLGSVVHGLLHRAHCPVITVPLV